MTEFNLQRNTFGRLVLTDKAGVQHEGVVPVHAFPITAPEQGIALISQDGRELVWVDKLEELDEVTQKLIREELASREFIPEIQNILSASTFATPSTWEIETNCGQTRMILKGEDDIRRINHNSLLITDSNGIHFLIRDTQKLNKVSKKILDRFL